MRRYFGRPAWLNAAISRALFAAAALRLGALRTRNRIRSTRGVVPPDATRAKEQWRNLRAQGFDKLNVGGGAKNLNGFVNVDFIPHAGVEREVVADISELSFVADGTVTHVHSNHVVEHLTLTDLRRLMRDSFRMLEPGGLLSIRCPNVLGVCYGFVFGPVFESEREAFVRLGFPADEDFGSAADGWYFQDFFALLHWIFGEPGNAANQHLSQMTPTLLLGLVRSEGFEILALTEPEATNVVVIARRPAA